MKRLIRDIAIFALGGGLGSIIAIRFTKKKYIAIAEEEINSMRDYFERTRDYGPDPVSEMTEEDYEAQMKKVANVVENMERKNNIMYEKPEQNTDYTKHHKQIEDQEGEVMNDLSERPNIPPHVISFESYQHENPHYDKLSITFYTEDAVLVDEDDEVITDETKVVGDVALMCFGEDSGDPDIVYVRNDQLAIDYEIAQIHRSYAEMRFGVIDDGISRKGRVSRDE